MRGEIKMMKKGLMVLIAFALIITPMTTEAKTVKKYATKTVALKEKKSTKAKTVCKVKKNTGLTQIKSGKTWSKVRYDGKTLYVKKKYLASKKAVKKYKGTYFKWAGLILWNGYRYTWYSQRVMAGGGLKIPQRHLDSQGFVCDKNDYIVLGSNVANRGKIVATPFGKFGKVYDAGCVGTNHFDVYTAW